MAALGIGVCLGDVPQATQCLGGENSGGALHADHLKTGLPLAVSAMLQAEGTKLIFGNLPALQLSDAFLKDTYFVRDCLGCMPCFHCCGVHNLLLGVRPLVPKSVDRMRVRKIALK